MRKRSSPGVSQWFWGNTCKILCSIKYIPENYLIRYSTSGSTHNKSLALHWCGNILEGKEKHLPTVPKLRFRPVLKQIFFNLYIHISWLNLEQQLKCLTRVNQCFCGPLAEYWLSGILIPKRYLKKENIFFVYLTERQSQESI